MLNIEPVFYNYGSYADGFTKIFNHAQMIEYFHALRYLEYNYGLVVPRMIRLIDQFRSFEIHNKNETDVLEDKIGKIFHHKEFAIKNRFLVFGLIYFVVEKTIHNSLRLSHIEYKLKDFSDPECVQAGRIKFFDAETFIDDIVNLSHNYPNGNEAAYFGMF